jgi:hypothetical protein
MLRMLIVAVWCASSGPIVLAGECNRFENTRDTIILVGYLKSDRASLDPNCVWVVMNHLGERKGDLDIARTLVEFLDYDASERPTRQRPIVTSRQMKYPAVSALFSIGEVVEPLLIEVLLRSTSSTQARSNAVLTLISLHRTDVSKSMEILRRAYWSIEEQSVAKKVLDAALNGARACGELRSQCESTILRRPR